MKYPGHYVSYLVEFHATRDFFECHELLEEYWKEHPEDERALIWVGLIQLAVGQYHERRGNLAGAAKMYEQALGKLTAVALDSLGLNGAKAVVELEAVLARAKQLEEAIAPAYQDMNLEIIDAELQVLCEQECTERGIAQKQWGLPSDMADEALIHRHTLRDRSDVIAARAEAIAARTKKPSTHNR
ncbi:hypothetical protein BBD42_23415 [Paenibacillus sp. BIHB 4019]|uniref:DUF309 domain-containing protein n=1 Tax=Paenibacillus sp. BIHB 4019 TaxID=1870819 RepID=A0A1B2DN16_9BACL|nr:DUF309 domain-containing protein [Paenibacillus sp. BIHB 4019]ANY69102.1 hypothetical protein BBD42_23415 [Paenibacillus sp. BIHB 4019]